jgi:acyl carrier protein
MPGVRCTTYESWEEGMQTLIILFSMSALLAVVQASCASGHPNSPPTVNVSGITQGRSNSEKPQEVLSRVTKIVAEILSLKPEEIEVNLPLTKQKNAADELDVVEIVLRVEEAYNIEIKDEELGGTLDDVTQDLTTRRLVDIVIKRMSANK